ncbi:MAG: hypothetical protein ABIQ10_03265 [Gemmatimonadaceae bacterium]
MSVLVESPSLIVRRAALDVRYPGGMNGFLRDMELPEHRVLRTCVDSHLVCVSFLLTMHARRVADKLATLGLKHIVDGQCIELVMVGNDNVLDVTCPSIEIETHSDGYTHAWLAACEPGELSAAQGWDYERADRTHADTFGEEWCDCARISNKDGLETWLDYRTGEMETRASTGASVRLESLALPMKLAHTEPLLPVVLGALAAAYVAITFSDSTSATFSGHRESGFYYHRMTVDEQKRSITCRCVLGTHVPEDQRAAVGELLHRINDGASNGMLIIDSETGWVTALMCFLIDSPAIGVSDVLSIWNSISDFAALHCEPIMRVAFGGRSPYEFATYTPTSE